MNGYETARRIRQSPWGRNMTLIAVTGWGQEEDRRSREAGFNLHLTKPIDANELEKLLAERFHGAKRNPASSRKPGREYQPDA
jgi:CheY-like chemotaxis protein